jgi:hypothetical protein
MKPSPILLCVLALAACSSKPPEPIATDKAKTADVTTPFDALKANEQRAKDVQKVADKHAEEQRKQIEAQER